jgi:hypothetical protein
MFARGRPDVAKHVARDDVPRKGIVYNFRKGDVLIWREWYGAGRGNNTGLHMTPDQVARGIIELEVQWGLRWQEPTTGKWVSRVKTGVADDQIFAKPFGAGEQGRSIADQMEDVVRYNGYSFKGPRFEPADKTPHSRTQGWSLMRTFLNGAVPNKDGLREHAGLFICENVRSFFDFVVTLPRDPKKPEDVPKVESLEDHSADCIRYRLRRDNKPNVQFRRIGGL